jgi:DNA helicase HerA-like ATPase
MSDSTPTLSGKILVGATAADERRAYRYLSLSLGNRHGLIAGATGGGKTVSLQLLAEGFANAGTSVFMADIKGDLSGLSQPGDSKPAFVNRAKDIGVAYAPDHFPVVFWDIFGEQGHTVRATVSQMGPLLMARLLNLNDTQEGVLNIIFKVADDQGLLMLDLKDLRAVINHVQENASEIRKTYGSVATASIGAIQRQLLVLETQGAENFFGEPALEISDFIRTDRDGRGAINILAADRLMRSPRLYGTFLLWMLSELFEALPEVGDLDKPKLVFFFDEAHLLFDDAPKALLGAIEQVVRLIRSKGVGVYFVTQNPLDVPDTVLGQLGNRIQHALRAFTPRDQKAVRAAASTFRQNPAFDTEDAILHLGVGEALVSMLGDKGAPEVVDRVLIAPPSARVGPITPAERAAVMTKSPFTGKYDGMIDRESAFEVLRDRAGGGKGGAVGEEAGAGGLIGALGGILGGLFGKANKKRLSPAEIALRSAVQSAARSAGTQIARQILRGVLGGMSR